MDPSFLVPRESANSSSDSSIVPSNKPNSSSDSSNKRKAEDSDTTIISKKSRFYESYLPQNFAFRDSMINYITNNPSSPKVWLKMIICCKYFFAQNPLVIISNLYYHDEEGWKTIGRSFRGDALQNAMSNFIPRIFRCDLKDIQLENQVIAFDELLLLSAKKGYVSFDNVTVYYKDGSVVPLEKIVQFYPDISDFQYTAPSIPTITSETAKNLNEIPHVRDIEYFILKNIPEDFDIECFFTDITNFRNKHFVLRFSNSISEAYKIRIDAVINKIRANKDPKCPITIHYNGINGENGNNKVIAYDR
uniref:Uncharacterized protein n=1 Tax=Panagrolaimus sp. PS1159 TaxID=55785 RepID=A0AC35FQP0_9BILA